MMTDSRSENMKKLTQKGLKGYMKNWMVHREEVVDFYLRTADEPTRRMIQRELQQNGCRIPRYVFERVFRRVMKSWGLA